MSDTNLNSDEKYVRKDVFEATMREMREMMNANREMMRANIEEHKKLAAEINSTISKSMLDLQNNIAKLSFAAAFIAAVFAGAQIIIAYITR